MQRQEEAEHEEELFKNVDPKKLAAVLLEALNNSKPEQMSEGEGRDGMEEEMTAEKEEYKNKDSYRKLRTIEGADRDRDGRQELELLMATQGKEQETGEEEERKKAQKEEELTERVTSRTTSHTVEIAREKPPTGSDGRGDNGQSTGSQQGSTSPDQASSEEEEQLSPEELKSLEMMMKEFPALNVPIKREGDSEQSHRESRDYSYNDIMPINKGSDLAITKKKLKWQEETQKALSFPKFRGDNFMDEFDDSNHNSADLQAPREQTMEDDDPDEEEEEDEEVLSPEEEEAQAKGEQEEMRRQAAEAQRAKMEEEMLADIASDMLLRYMVKQNNGNKQYSSSLSSAAEDKRSDEEQEVTEEDDIDPQTIDKLIEISSKLHLPADDVVDIISDVEKKKKKDLSPDVISGWRRPLSPISSPFSSESQISSNQNDIPASNQPFPAAHFLKTWLQKKNPTRSEDLWNKPAKPQLGNQNIWAQPPVPIKQDLWLTSPKAAWTRYPHYPLFPHTYPSYYQKKPYKGYPIYVPPAPRLKPYYLILKPALTLNNFLTHSVDDVYAFSPKRRYNSWVQPKLRKPPTGQQQKSYYTRYPLSLYPWTFQPASNPKLHPLPRIHSQQKQLYYSAPAPADYYVAGKQPDSNYDDLEKYIQQISMKKPYMMDWVQTWEEGREEEEPQAEKSVFIYVKVFRWFFICNKFPVIILIGYDWDKDTTEDFSPEVVWIKRMKDIQLHSFPLLSFNFSWQHSLYGHFKMPTKEDV